MRIAVFFLPQTWDFWTCCGLLTQWKVNKILSLLEVRYQNKTFFVEHMLVNDEEAIWNDNYSTKSDQNKKDQQKKSYTKHMLMAR